MGLSGPGFFWDCDGCEGALLTKVDCHLAAPGFHEGARPFYFNRRVKNYGGISACFGITKACGTIASNRYQIQG